MYTCIDMLTDFLHQSNVYCGRARLPCMCTPAAPSHRARGPLATVLAFLSPVFVSACLFPSSSLLPLLFVATSVFVFPPPLVLLSASLFAFSSLSLYIYIQLGRRQGKSRRVLRSSDPSRSYLRRLLGCRLRSNPTQESPRSAPPDQQPNRRQQ